MTDSKKRIALKPHIGRIREWVDEGKTDDWIADALGTSASSVQSFRSRNDIYRRDRHGGYKGEPANVFEGVLDHGERDGWGLWFDPAVADDPVWREHWSKVDSVVVKLAEDSIVLEIADSEPAESASERRVPSAFSLKIASSEGSDGFSDDDLDGRSDGAVSMEEPILRMDSDEPQDGVEEDAVESVSEDEPEALGERERGRVKWFDPEKGYGFLIRPTGEDLFVHHSEIEGDAAELGLGGDVEYAVGRNDRGPNARSVRLLPA